MPEPRELHAAQTERTVRPPARLSAANAGSNSALLWIGIGAGVVLAGAVSVLVTIIIGMTSRPGKPPMRQRT